MDLGSAISQQMQAPTVHRSASRNMPSPFRVNRTISFAQQAAYDAFQTGAHSLPPQQTQHTQHVQQATLTQARSMPLLHDGFGFPAVPADADLSFQESFPGFNVAPMPLAHLTHSSTFPAPRPAPPMFGQNASLQHSASLPNIGLVVPGMHDEIGEQFPANEHLSIIALGLSPAALFTLRQVRDLTVRGLCVQVTCSTMAATRTQNQRAGRKARR